MSFSVRITAIISVGLVALSILTFIVDVGAEVSNNGTGTRSLLLLLTMSGGIAGLSNFPALLRKNRHPAAGLAIIMLSFVGTLFACRYSSDFERFASAGTIQDQPAVQAEGPHLGSRLVVQSYVLARLN